MISLSAVIITFNEENNIGRCLTSVKDVADEIIVVDSNSTDRTEAICTSFDVRFVSRPFGGHIEQKNFAMGLASFPYVLSLDADEALSEELIRAVMAAKAEWSCDGYAVSRLTNYCGSWIRHTDWYPDRKIRLWDKRKGRWAGVNPHDHVLMEPGSRTAELRGDLLHYSYSSIDRHLEQLNYFTDIMARESFKKGKKIGPVNMLFNPSWKFLKSYFFRLGFLDGFHGFVIAAISSFATFIKYAKLRQMHRDAGQSADGDAHGSTGPSEKDA